MECAVGVSGIGSELSDLGLMLLCFDVEAEGAGGLVGKEKLSPLWVRRVKNEVERAV